MIHRLLMTARNFSFLKLLSHVVRQVPTIPDIRRFFESLMVLNHQVYHCCSGVCGSLKCEMPHVTVVDMDNDLFQSSLNVVYRCHILLRERPPPHHDIVVPLFKYEFVACYAEKRLLWVFEGDIGIVDPGLNLWAPGRHGQCFLSNSVSTRKAREIQITHLASWSARTLRAT